MRNSVLFVELGIDATNDQIVDQMRLMKRAREEGFYRHIVATIRGFGDDPRELFDIPELRAFCRRVVNIGFVSYWDVTTLIDPHIPDEAKTGWGAYEFWLCGEGRLKMEMDFTRACLKEIERLVAESNTKAAALLGPLFPPGSAE